MKLKWLFLLCWFSAQIAFADTVAPIRSMPPHPVGHSQSIEVQRISEINEFFPIDADASKICSHAGAWEPETCELRVKIGVRGLSFLKKNLNLENASALGVFWTDKVEALYSKSQSCTPLWLP